MVFYDANKDCPFVSLSLFNGPGLYSWSQNMLTLKEWESSVPLYSEMSGIEAFWFGKFVRLDSTCWPKYP